MEIKPIKTEEDYENALAEIEGLMDAAQDTPEGDRLDILAALVEAYEDKRYPVPFPDPIAEIVHLMESQGFGLKDIEPHIEEKPKAMQAGGNYRD